MVIEDGDGDREMEGSSILPRESLFVPIRESEDEGGDENMEATCTLHRETSFIPIREFEDEEIADDEDNRE